MVAEKERTVQEKQTRYPEIEVMLEVDFGQMVLFDLNKMVPVYFVFTFFCSEGGKTYNLPCIFQDYKVYPDMNNMNIVHIAAKNPTYKLKSLVRGVKDYRWTLEVGLRGADLMELEKMGVVYDGKPYEGNFKVNKAMLFIDDEELIAYEVETRFTKTKPNEAAMPAYQVIMQYGKK